ncbi:MAG: glycosyltransferase family 39 protein [Bacteroidetes bacterium]|nr:glycosyltransferase family 39 protein [Bacteroidota bacterium]MDA1119646.1 glycosyltransferase family 39 protein [Bacteroidota bacterium]
MKDYLWIGLLAMVIALGSIVLSSNIGGHSIYLLDEAKNAQCAREMMESGSWIIPTFNGELRMDKPPLHYYFMRLAYAFFGVNEFAARFFSVFFGVLTLAAVYLFSQRYLGIRSAVFISLALISSIGFMLQFHLAVPDPYLIFLIVLAIFSFYEGYNYNKPVWIYSFYIACALAMLTKGPIGVIIPGGVALAFGVIRNGVKLKWIKDLRPHHGLAIFLILTLPWYLSVGFMTDWAWVEGFFVDHNYNRFINPLEGHGGFFLLPMGYLLIMALPLGIFSISAIGQAIKDRANDFILLSLLTVGLILLIFMISATKLPNYVSPALPFVAIVIGNYLSKTKTPHAIEKLWIIILMAFAMIIPLLLGYLLDNENYSNLLVEGLWSAMPIIFGVLTGGAMLLYNKLIPGIAIFILAFIFSIRIAFIEFVPKIDDLNPVKMAGDYLDEESNVASFYIFNPAFSFYLNQSIPVFDQVNQIEKYLNTQDNAIIITRSNVLNELYGLNLDTVLIQQNLFEQTTTAVLREKSEITVSR